MSWRGYQSADHRGRGNNRGSTASFRRINALQSRLWAPDYIRIVEIVLGGFSLDPLKLMNESNLVRGPGIGRINFDCIQ